MRLGDGQIPAPLDREEAQSNTSAAPAAVVSVGGRPSRRLVGEIPWFCRWGRRRCSRQHVYSLRHPVGRGCSRNLNRLSREQRAIQRTNRRWKVVERKWVPSDFAILFLANKWLTVPHESDLRHQPHLNPLKTRSKKIAGKSLPVYAIIYALGVIL